VTYPEVEWVLEAIDADLGGSLSGYTLDNGDSVNLILINRDDSDTFSGSLRSRTEELRRGIIVGVTRADQAKTPIGTEYDLDVETIAGVRVEGLHHHQRGHVDPDGNEGVPFDELEQLLRDPLWTRRAYPDAGNSRTTYHTLRIENDTQASSDYGSYFRTDFDVRFDGYEDLPAPQHP